ncbi:MAG: hypothetical protein LBH90_03855 [Tannerella sp.]|jgi:hypothetical protein|nr:hypothetical protein [Tannerella sp.]
MRVVQINELDFKGQNMLACEGFRKRMIAQKTIVKIARKLVNSVFFVLKRKEEYVPCVVVCGKFVYDKIYD